MPAVRLTTLKRPARAAGTTMIATAIVVGLLLAALAWLAMKLRFDAKN